MGRGGIADMTSLLNFGEEHHTSVWRRALTFSKPDERQTALLFLPLTEQFLLPSLIWDGYPKLEVFMTYVITQPCIGVKDASCVDVCPVDCIHPTQSEEGFDTAEMLYINPDECIDCGACEPACPVMAEPGSLVAPALSR